jgi:3-oxoacyl-[acyl-carrier protein] reductase
MDGSEKVLDGKNILVIGGGGEGIGRAITRGLAAAGGAMAVADVDRERARPRRRRLPWRVPGDVRAAEGRPRLVSADVAGDARRDTASPEVMAMPGQPEAVLARALRRADEARPVTGHR